MIEDQFTNGNKEIHRCWSHKNIQGNIMNASKNLTQLHHVQPIEQHVHSSRINKCMTL